MGRPRVKRGAHAWVGPANLTTAPDGCAGFSAVAATKQPSEKRHSPGPDSHHPRRQAQLPRFGTRINAKDIFAERTSQMLRVRPPLSRSGRRWTRVVNRGLQEAGGGAIGAGILDSPVGLR